jgi:hypothetical protein
MLSRKSNKTSIVSRLNKTIALAGLKIPLTLFFGLLLTAGHVQSATIGFLSEIHAKNNKFSIYNNSDNGFTITAVDVTLSSPVTFGTPSLDSSITINHFDSFDYNVSGVEGGAASGGQYFTSVLVNEGLTSTLDFSDHTANLTFNDFDAGEAFGVSVVYLPEDAAGADFTASMISVTFSDGQTLSYEYIGNGGKVSFPADASATAVSAVPLPAAAWPFGSALLGLVGIARRKRA